MKLTLGFSPCPNDCFMFDAIVNKRIDLHGLSFDIQMQDVETLNKAAFTACIDITKLSYHAYAYASAQYVLLDSGSALGRNCGPLLISKRPITQDQAASGQLKIAIPGKYTTANFLLGLAFPKATNKTPMVFSQIQDAVLSGQYDAGLIIHENRFTYEAKGLRKVIDLGEYWEAATGLPIPLGAIVAKRSLPLDIQLKIQRILKASVEYAFAHRQASLPLIRANAQEMDEAVMYRHIDLYVNAFSISLGQEGRQAVQTLFDKAIAAGVVPGVTQPIFLTPGSLA